MVINTIVETYFKEVYVTLQKPKHGSIHCSQRIVYKLKFPFLQRPVNHFWIWVLELGNCRRKWIRSDIVMSLTKRFGNGSVITNVIITPFPSNCSVLQNTLWIKLLVPLTQHSSLLKRNHALANYQQTLLYY